MNDDFSILETIPDWFWQQIDLARSDRARFDLAVRDMSREDLIGFAQTFDLAAAELQGPSHTEYVDPVLSEDGVADVASWVVTQGRDHYIDVLDNPHKMPKRVDDHDPVLSITSEVIGEYYRRYDTSLPLF